MKAKEMIEYLQKQDSEREVCLWEWAGEESKFYALNPTATPKANTENLICFMGNGLVKPIRAGDDNE